MSKWWADNMDNIEEARIYTNKIAESPLRTLTLWF